jgi:hypothetical protein
VGVADEVGEVANHIDEERVGGTLFDMLESVENAEVLYDFGF